MVEFKIRHPEDIDDIPVKDILKFARENWYWIYPLLQTSYELLVKLYYEIKKTKKPRRKRKKDKKVEEKNISSNN